MQERSGQNTKVLWILKSLLGAYVVTGILLMFLGLLLYKFDLDEKKVAIGIIVIYVVGTFCGGFLIGKYMKKQKYIWGCILGLLYFLLLLIITLGVYRTMQNGDIVTTMMLCICGGTIGGMLS